MLNGLVSDGKFAQVMSDHLRSDFNLVVGLAVVHTNDRSNHFGEHDHVSEVSLDDSRLLAHLAFLLALPQFLQKSLMVLTQTTPYAAALAAGEKLRDLLPNFHYN